MEGAKIHRLIEAINNTGFIVKKIEEDVYVGFERPASGEKYTGELIIRIRPLEDEEDDLEKIRVWKEKRKEKERAGNARRAGIAADTKEEVLLEL